ncbi:unnamed protein product [Owenia fusiformis]|uniref:RING-type domain-containing protein n=1 Tax=Owenia fusiformis TaxID=6347 RepID=A0A8S4N3R7_OWEFU|nr:unnamed protein product [Owenia fusiformis]
MASIAVLKDRINDEHLTCMICLGQFQRPKALPCLHSFCLDCIKGFITSKMVKKGELFGCPVCRKKIKLPNKGVGGFPNNHLIMSLMGTMDDVPETTDDEEDVPSAVHTPQTHLAETPATTLTTAIYTDTSSQPISHTIVRQSETPMGSQTPIPSPGVSGSLSNMQTDQLGELGVEVPTERPSPTPIESDPEPHVHIVLPDDTRNDAQNPNAPEQHVTLDPPQQPAFNPAYRDPSYDPESLRDTHSPPLAYESISPNVPPLPGTPMDTTIPEYARPPLSPDDSIQYAHPMQIPSNYPPTNNHTPIFPIQPTQISIPLPRSSIQARHIIRMDHYLSVSPWFDKWHIPDDSQNDRQPTTHAVIIREQSRFGQFGYGLSDFTRPIGLAVTSGGRVIVGDQYQSRVLVFNRSGLGQGGFQCRGVLAGLAVTQEDNICVTVNRTGGSHLAEVYTIEGHLVTKVGSTFAHETSLGVAIDLNDQIIITTKDAVLYRFTPTGKLAKSWSKKGRFTPSLMDPYFATSSNNDIIISDYDNQAVKIYNKEGEFKSLIGQLGREKGNVSNTSELKQPLGVCTDLHGNFIIADSGNFRVCAYSSDGKFLRDIISDTRYGNGNLVRPYNVALGPNRVLYVLLVGPSFAEIRAYHYEGKGSTTCAVM